MEKKKEIQKFQEDRVTIINQERERDFEDQRVEKVVSFGGNRNDNYLVVTRTEQKDYEGGSGGLYFTEAELKKKLQPFDRRNIFCAPEMLFSYTKKEKIQNEVIKTGRSALAMDSDQRIKVINHLVTKIEYMGRNEPHLEAFQNLFGLHRTFFHLMFERRDAGLLSDFVEFITQEWGNTLAHPKFSTFKLESMEIFRLMCQSHGHSKQTSCELFARVLQKIISNAHPEKLSKKGKDSKVDKHESNEKEKNDENEYKQNEMKWN